MLAAANRVLEIVPAPVVNEVALLLTAAGLAWLLPSPLPAAK